MYSCLGRGAQALAAAPRIPASPPDGPIVKVLEILVSLAYVVYDAVTQDPPGTGTTALIVVTCLAEIFLIYQEYLTIYKYGGLKVRSMSPEPSPCTPKP